MPTKLGSAGAAAGAAASTTSAAAHRHRQPMPMPMAMPMPDEAARMVDDDANIWCPPPPLTAGTHSAASDPAVHVPAPALLSGLHNLDSSLRCHICSNLYVTPTLLRSCGHTFCGLCLSTSLKHQVECGTRRVRAAAPAAPAAAAALAPPDAVNDNSDVTDDADPAEVGGVVQLEIIGGGGGGGGHYGMEAWRDRLQKLWQESGTAARARRWKARCPLAAVGCGMACHIPLLRIGQNDEY
jgi:hypothetical protein